MRNKKLTIYILITTILLVLTNVYAWFMFNRNASVTLEGNIKSWDISFLDGEEEVIEKIDFNIKSIFPGMEKAEKKLVIKNKSDIAAELEYKIKSIRVFEEQKIVGENCTEEELNEYLQSLPFDINVEFSKYVLEEKNDISDIKISMFWSFEDAVQDEIITEKDRKDTELGIKAYEYNNQEVKQDNNFSVQIQLIARQKNIGI